MNMRYENGLYDLSSTVYNALKSLGGPIPALLEYPDGRVEQARLGISTCGALMRLGYKKKKRGTYFSTHGLRAITLVPPTSRAFVPPAAWYAEELRKYRNYFLRHSHPKMWQDLRDKLSLVTDAMLAEIAQMNFADSSELYRFVNQHRLPWVERFRTTTLKTCQSPEYVMAGIAQAIEKGEDFEFDWRGRYDYTASGRMCPDGVYRAWLDEEYKDCGNGHYWLLVSPCQALFGEDD